MRNVTRRTAVIAATTASVVGVGVAFAAWTLNGTGSGYDKALTAQAVSTQSPGSVTADLYPGSTSGTLQIDVTNPNTFDATVTAISLTGATIASGDTNNCPSANFTLDNTKSWSGTQVVSGSGDHVFTISNAVGLISTAPNGCQGVTATVTLAASAITAAVGS